MGGNKKARSFSVPSLSWRSYSSIMCFRSSSDLTDTKASRSSGTIWYLRTISPSKSVLSFFINSEKEMSRQTATTRVSPPTYLSLPSVGLGKIFPPWLHKNFTLFFGDDCSDDSYSPSLPIDVGIANSPLEGVNSASERIKSAGWGRRRRKGKQDTKKRLKGI